MQNLCVQSITEQDGELGHVSLCGTVQNFMSRSRRVDYKLLTHVSVRKTSNVEQVGEILIIQQLPHLVLIQHPDPKSRVLLRSVLYVTWIKCQ